MEATIDGENQEYVKIYVTDTNGVDHEFTIEKASGDVEYYEQDGYPDDPGKRTEEGKRHVGEARRFARYYVYQERGYDILPTHRTPDRISGVLLAVQSMSIEQFEEFLPT